MDVVEPSDQDQESSASGRDRQPDVISAACAGSELSPDLLQP